MSKRWLACWLLLPVVLAGTLHTDAARPNRAALVVRTAKGIVQTVCVPFDGPSIDGLTLLQKAGFAVNVQASGNNAAICSINTEGCNFPSEVCFCQCNGSPCVYWGYWHLVNDHWQISQLGAPVYAVKPGNVDGWAWGKTEPPPVISFEQICQPAPAVLPTVKVVPTVKDRPTVKSLPTRIQPTDEATAPSSVLLRPTMTATTRPAITILPTADTSGPQSASQQPTTVPTSLPTQQFSF